jgi:hypothetical protein
MPDVSKVLHEPSENASLRTVLEVNPWLVESHAELTAKTCVSHADILKRLSSRVSRVIFK